MLIQDTLPHFKTIRDETRTFVNSVKCLFYFDRFYLGQKSEAGYAHVKD